MAAHPIEVFYCRNVDCPDFRIREKENLRWHGWSGHSHRILGIYCRTCRKYFSERKGIVLEQSRLPEEKVESLLEHLREGCGVRQTARLTHVSQNTVNRLIVIGIATAILYSDANIPINIWILPGASSAINIFCLADTLVIAFRHL
ncbi:hypothetical protein CCP3SC1_210009 [Gammaproteobacteria bacterium]